VVVCQNCWLCERWTWYVGLSVLVSPCSPLISQLPQVDCNCQLPQLVCQNYWLSTERSSFGWRACIAGLLLMAFTFLSCRFLVVCISVITHRPLYGWKAYIWQGACPVRQRDNLRHYYHHSTMPHTLSSVHQSRLC